jgi:hypothetical protein
MINEKQPFTDQDLFQSVDELAAVSMGPYVSKPLMFSVNKGTDFFDLREISPTEYYEMIRDEYDNTPSSARALDQQLEAKGFSTTYKFSYNYKMPPQMRDRIVKDGWILGYFQNIFNHPNLPRNEVVHNKQFEQSILNALHVTYGYAQFIWYYNPNVYDYTNLLNPSTGWYHVLNFVIGAGYEFHPLDIKFHEKVFADNYHINREEYNKKTEFKRWCKEQYDIDTGCLILSDVNMAKLRMILTNQERLM